MIRAFTFCFCYQQARNQLGTPGGAKSFLRGAYIFWTMAYVFKLCPTHFSRGASSPWTPLVTGLVIRPHVIQDRTNSLNGSWCTKCRTSGVARRDNGGSGPRAEPSRGRQFVDWKLIFESSLIVPTLLYYF